MSTQAIASSIAEPPDAIAAGQRVQQLQSLLAQTGSGSSMASFAEALQAAASSAQASPASSATASAPLASSASAQASPTEAPSVTALADYSYPQTSTPSSTGSADAGSSSPSSSSGTPYDGLVEQAAERYGLDPALLHGLIQQESGFDPSSRSSAGAEGLTQLMPGTAASLGVTEPLNPAQSIEGGARYLSQLLTQFGGNTSDALAAYNAGPGAVQKYGGVPPYAETQDYVSKVLGYAQAYRAANPPAALTGSTS